MTAILFGICSVLFQPSTAPATPPPQPTSRPVAAGQPRVFRCTLDGRPRTVVIELGPDLWMAFDAERCLVEKVWRGDVLLTGPVFDTKHGPQPQSRGETLWAELPSPWSPGLSPNFRPPPDSPKSPDGPAYERRWVGYRVDNGVPTVLYRLFLYVRDPIRSDRPDAVVEVEDGSAVVADPADPASTTIRRRVRVAGLPPDVRLTLKLPTPAMSDARVDAAGSAPILKRMGTTTATRPSTQPTEWPIMAEIDADGVHEFRLAVPGARKERR